MERRILPTKEPQASLLNNTELNTFQSFLRVERALEKCPTTRSRVGGTRKLPPTITDMNTDKETILPPQGSPRSLSGRRECSTVPGTLSSPGVGPTPLLQTGEENKAATVEEVEESVPRDPLDISFVDCSCTMDRELEAYDQAENQAVVEDVQTANISRLKRKARISSGGATPSDDEQGHGFKKDSETSPVALRKLRSRKKKRVQVDLNTSSEITDEMSSAKMSARSDQNSDTENKTNKKKTTSKGSSQLHIPDRTR